ncbi:MAG: pyrroline-5-carboxylate reductase [Aigarchaeota archaeon]|nr:pyrroline-5-carboxylate reductase [Candidatus Geocrenenecus dongiae]
MKMVGIGIIGAGQIGSAIARILVEAGRFHVMASRRNLSSIRELEKIGVKITTSNIEVASNSDIVFICVKPYKVIQVVREISSHLDGKILISVAAAISIRQLSEAAPKAKIVRAMPNIALMVKTSFTAYTFGPNLTDEDKQFVREIFSLMGECMEIDEEYMDAITALSGSGPAYVATLIEAMAYAGLKVGLPRELSYRSAAYTVYGSAKLFLETGLHPSMIKEMVLTPAGVTIEGIFYLEESGIRTAVMKAVEAATKRAKEISNELNKKSLE